MPIKLNVTMKTNPGVIFGRIEKRIQQVVTSEVRRMGRSIKSSYESTTKTWAYRPKFEKEEESTSDGIIIKIYTVSDKYRFLDEGTKLRWALMSNNWKSKTKPNRLSSHRGDGTVMLRGKRAFLQRGMPPKPGVEARNWTKMIAEDRRKSARKNILNAIRGKLG